MRFYLFVYEDGHYIFTGNHQGYESYTEAKEVAKKKVDDALPQNRVLIMACLGYAWLGGDGEAYVKEEEHPWK